MAKPLEQLLVQPSNEEKSTSSNTTSSSVSFSSSHPSDSVSPIQAVAVDEDERGSYSEEIDTPPAVHEQLVQNVHSSAVEPSTKQTAVSTPTKEEEKKKWGPFKWKTERQTKEPISWWWWWEIAATILSMASMLLILVVLFKVNNTRLEAWTLPIQPNSLISVFTTVGKTAMMVPVASCISQLKWRHFRQRSNRLSHLQLFEDASRGPWGSFKLLLLSARADALTVAGLALVSLVALGVDPAAQQILDFPQRETTLTNYSVMTGFAKNYTSIVYTSIVYTSSTEDVVDGVPVYITLARRKLALQLSIMNGIGGTAFQPYFACPVGRCAWPDFTTLGVSGKSDNVTDHVRVTCSGSTFDQLHCNYSFPATSTDNLGFITLNMTYAQQNSESSRETTLFQSKAYVYPAGEYPGGIVLYVVRTTDNLTESSTQPPPTESFILRWTWCARTYFDTVAEPDIAIYNTGSEITYLTTVGNTCSNSTVCAYQHPETNETYRVNRNTEQSLFGYVASVLGNLTVKRESQHAGARLNDDFALASFLYTADLENLARNLEETLTNQIRTNPTMVYTGVLGDNIESEWIEGWALVTEPYIHVRWPWLILPLVVAALTAVLLISSILLARGEPLLKSSVLALLGHEIDGWKPEDLRVNKPKTAEKLEYLFEGMAVRLVEDEDGKMIFIRSELEEKS